MRLSPGESAPDIDADLRQAAARYFPDATNLSLVGERRHLLRIEAESGTWCLRRWPETTPRERIDFVHTLLETTRTAGLSFMPTVATTAEGESIVQIEGRSYDTQSWLPGRAPVREVEIADDRQRVINRPAPLSANALNAAVRSIASLHAATEDLAAHPDVPRASLEAVLRAIRMTWDEQRQRLRPFAPRTPHIQRWIRSGEPVFDGAAESITAANFLQLRPRVISHLNLWPAHLLLARRDGGDAVTGLVDFAEAAAASPLLDLAQLVTHFNGWSGGAAEAAIGAYTDVRPLAPEERRLLPAIAGLDLLVETGRLLVLGHATPLVAETGGGDAIRNAASTLLQSLEAIAPAVQRGDRPEPSKARKWDYGPPRGPRPGPRRSPRGGTPRDRR